MAEALTPRRGGFLRPFGAAIFIRDFLNGEGTKYGAPRIDPAVGAPQADIHAAYKLALHMAIAEDAAALDAEEAIRQGKPLTPDQVEERRLFYLERIPYKLTRMRYASFTNYFARLLKLGWVEPTGRVERSEPQENWPQARPRVYYRLTEKGRAATLVELSNPLRLLYPYFTAEYFRQARKEHHYFHPPARTRR